MFDNMYDTYTTVALLCFYLTMLSAIPTVLIVKEQSVMRTFYKFFGAGLVLSILWPLLLPCGAICLPFWIKQIDEKFGKSYAIVNSQGRKEDGEEENFNE